MLQLNYFKIIFHNYINLDASLQKCNQYDHFVNITFFKFFIKKMILKSFAYKKYIDKKNIMGLIIIIL